MFQLDSETVQLKFAVDDQNWMARSFAGQNRRNEMIAVFGADIVVTTIGTHPMVVALSAAEAD